MNSRGFSLIELIIIVSIMAILLTIATIDFNSWTRKYQTEAQTREIYSDLVKFRLNAIQRKQRSAVFYGPKSYVFKTYSSPFENVAKGTQVLSKTFNYEIKKGTDLNVFDIASDCVEFDSRGITNNQMTIIVLPVQYNAGENCILVSAGRTNIGRMIDAATCRPR